MMDYSLAQFGTSSGSDIAVVAPSSLTSKLETTFCRNFTCCNQQLDDLHDLLQHYEECHVRFGEGDDFSSPTPPSMINDDGSSEDSSNSSSPSSPKSIAAAAAAAAGVGGPNKVGALPIASALNAPGTAAANAAANRKRAFNQMSTTPQNPSAVQSSLRRALAEGGGLSAPRRSGSPFSTPGASVPGTPACEQELDTLLGGNGATSAFSALSLRNNFEDHNLPSCAPPNLFFPATGTASQTVSTTNQPPHPKRERLNSDDSNGQVSGLIDPNKFDPKTVIVLPGNVEKPYKCPAAGCDKAYKQMNGLKYHRLHGHCNQNNAPILNTAGVQAAALQAQFQAQSTPTGSPTSTTPSAAFTPAAAASGTPTPGGLGATPKPGIFNAAAAAVPTTPTGASGLPRGLVDSTPTSTASNSPFFTAAALPGSPAASHAALAGFTDANGQSGVGIQRSSSQSNKPTLYLCQVGTCGKTYKNLNGLRYHYLHSGSHGLLGLQVLHAHGGGNSAKMGDDGRALVSTDTLKPDEVAQAARLAAEMQAKKTSVTQKTVDMIQAQALAGGGPGHNHKQAQELEAIVAADEA